MSMMLAWMSTSSVLILIVLALRALFRDKLSARLRYALWAVVLVRLLIPFQVPIPGALGMVDAVQPVGQALEARMDGYMVRVLPTQAAPSHMEPVGAPSIAPAVQGDALPSIAEVPQRSPGDAVTDDTDAGRYLFSLPLDMLFAAVWLVGCLVLLCWMGLANLRFSAALRRDRRAFPIQNVLIPVYITSRIPSPCLFGLFRPAVYLTPGAAADECTRAHVLAHELTHHAHRDHIWAPLRCVCLALHWYNPLVWLAVALSRGDGELACDEGAVARLGEGERLRYGRTLVDMVARRRSRPADLFSCSTAMTQGKKSIQQRVARLVKRPETVKTALFTSVSVLVLAVVFVFAGQSAAKPDSYAQYLAQVESAQAIHIGEPLISSFFSPGTITGPEGLEQAKALLLAAKPAYDMESGEWEELNRLINTEPEEITTSELYRALMENGRPLALYSTSDPSLDPDPFLEGGGSFWLVQWKQNCLLVRWALSEQGEAAVELVGLLPVGTVGQLRAIQSRLASASGPAAVPEGTARLQVYFGPASSFLAPELTDFDLLAQARDILNSGDPDSGTVNQLSQYDGTYVTFYGEDGARLGSLSLSDQEICEHLFQLSWEQYRRNETRLSSVPNGQDALPSDSAPTDKAAPLSAGAISAGVSVPAALLPTVEQMLSSNLNDFQRSYSEPQAAVHLTAFTKLLQYNRLLKAGTVCVYHYDYAFSDVDGGLSRLQGWSGIPGTNGPWQEENGLVHPTHLNQYLLTVERDGQVVQCTSFEDYVLMREGELDGAVDADYLLDKVAAAADRMLRPSIPSSITDAPQAVEAYAQSLADYYLSLGPEHPSAVTSAQVAQVELLERDIYSVCAKISLALDPVKPDMACWISENGFSYQADGPWAGHWLNTLEYYFDYETGWYCVSYGVSSVSSYHAYGKHFTAMPDREVNLTATLDRKARTISLEGETGILKQLYMSNRTVEFTTGALPPTPTIEALTAAIDNGEQDLSRWLRVYADGQRVPGTASYSGTDLRSFTYTFDCPLPYDSGFIVTVELGAGE